MTSMFRLSSSAPRAELVTITPEMAAEWLEANKGNRKVRESKVRQYSDDMANGCWRVTGESIKFDVNGRMIDGQHRLLAIVRTERSVQMFVHHGLDVDVQAVLDTGATRSAGDNISMAGESHAHALAAVGRLGYVVDSGLLFKDRKLQQAISHAMVYDWINRNPEVRTSVSFVYSGAPRKIPTLTPSVKSYTHYRFSRLSTDDANEFYTTLGTHIGFVEGDARAALSSRLRTIADQKSRVEARAQLHLVYRAWNAWREGRLLGQLPLAKRIESLPEPA